MPVAADYEREAPAPDRQDRRIPVYLLTGYLGSGKTTLLKAWLAASEFKDAALIINELGEVGLDNQLLASATESSSLVANACICCTGLPGLEEALEEMFWARLHRRIPAFPCLVIETTGLAEPGPVTQALTRTELLKERYRLAGVITCLSASTAREVLQHHAEARAQLAGADLLVITKTDLVPADTLQTLQVQLQHQRSDLSVATSSHASLSCSAMLDLLQPNAVDHHHADEATHDHDGHHAHEHNSNAHWLALPQPLLEASLLREIENLQQRLGPALLRLKGRVQTEQGRRLVQLAPFDPHAVVSDDPVLPTSSDAADDPRVWGLTLIIRGPVSPDVVTAMNTSLLKTAAR